MTETKKAERVDPETVPLMRLVRAIQHSPSITDEDKLKAISGLARMVKNPPVRQAEDRLPLFNPHGTPANILLDGFIWRNTPEGWYFWDRIQLSLYYA